MLKNEKMEGARAAFEARILIHNCLGCEKVDLKKHVKISYYMRTMRFSCFFLDSFYRGFKLPLPTLHMYRFVSHPINHAKRNSQLFPSSAVWRSCR